MADIQEHIDRLVRDHALAVERLTEQQLASAIRQAIESGDFVKYVARDPERQQVVYMPGRGVDELRSRVSWLEGKLREHGIDPHAVEDLD